MSRIVVDFGDAVDDSEVGGGWVRVMVDGRECAMREEGLRGYWVLKGPKPVIRTLTSSEDSISGSAFEEESWRRLGGMAVMNVQLWRYLERGRNGKVDGGGYRKLI